MWRKVIRFVDKSIDGIVLVVSLLLFLICVYAMIDAAGVYYHANDTGVLKYKPRGREDAAVLRQLSDDAVAWLTVDGTGIDYPVMQGKNNTEYLNKDPYGAYSLSGSIFLDSRCDGRFQGDYSLLYGHHMEYGAMFGALDAFIRPDYFQTHRTGSLITAEGAAYRITFFACMKVQADELTVFDPQHGGTRELLDYLQENAGIYEAPASQDVRLIALSTCQSPESIERIVVFGVLNGP